MSRLFVRTTLAALAIAAGALLGQPAAQAADAPVYKAAPLPTAFNPWMFRLRGLVVHPDAGASLNTAAGPMVGASVDISTSVVPEFDITYFFTKNIAAELILGVTPHRAKGAGTLAGTPIGNAWLLPPTLTLQYHFTDLGPIKPYVGAGINYTVFFNEKAKGPFVTFDLEDSFGFALQAGVDIMLNQNWGINLDVKKLFLEPKVSVNSGLVTGKVKIDPWLFGFGVTYKM